MILQVLFCILVADFVTGLVHWWEDTYGLPTWPIIGALVIEPNIDHHKNPTFMVIWGSVVGRNLQSLALAAVVCVAAWLSGWLTWQLALTATLAGFGNEVHAWAHGGGNAATRLLQDMGLVITPTHHAKHHKPPYEIRFCTLTNWLNPVLDRLYFWRSVEWLLSLVGIRPHRMTAARDFV